MAASLTPTWSVFFAARCIDAIGARPQNGVVRASLEHYNGSHDVDRLIDGLDALV